MRLYVPVVQSDLSAELPPARDGWAAAPAAGTDAEGVEVLEDDAQTEAALASLLLLRDGGPGEAPVRMILAVDGPAVLGGAVEGVARATVGPYRWEDVAAILVDGDEAAGEVRRVLGAQEQDEADEAVAALWDHALQWYDIEERQELAARLAAGAAGPGRADRSGL
ncbi:hypothetical protein M3T53_03005 [Actinomyces sp. B33]|uniref:DUF6912 family protein n=1 Tax=Actinomyces sp. B33 TaxID=2942131 RepID=UPI002340F3CB|nr:hypothetical protein [Actinomyces sp. B33]MDC4232685.1 hypothetical protein [Actinomyces sp. B33]